MKGLRSSTETPATGQVQPPLFWNLSFLNTTYHQSNLYPFYHSLIPVIMNEHKEVWSALFKTCLVIATVRRDLVLENQSGC